MKHVSLPLTLLAFALLVGCAKEAAPAREPTSTTAPTSAVLVDDAGKGASLDERANKAGLTVLLFFTAECPVQKAHDDRVRDIAKAYAPRGVTFYAVSSEIGADVAAERAEAKRRALGMPLLEDKGAALANALGVEYSTHVVVLDKERHIVYSGAVDADRTHLTEGGEPYLKNALDAALDNKPIPKAKTEALGCPIRKK